MRCPKCGAAIDSPDVSRLKSIMRSVVVANKLADYLLGDVPQKDWHPEVKEFAYKNLLINRI